MKHQGRWEFSEIKAILSTFEKSASMSEISKTPPPQLLHKNLLTTQNPICIF
jgi:hypothetical protein